MLYLITLEDSRLIKVGYTDNLKNRLKDYNGSPVRLLDVIEGSQKDEKAYHFFLEYLGFETKVNYYGNKIEWSVIPKGVRTQLFYENGFQAFQKLYKKRK